jgi:predicted negative regulator of RcsB-dependent stress response
MSENKIPERDEPQAPAAQQTPNADVQDFMALVNEYGKPLLIAAVVAGVAALGFATWKNRQARQAEAESAALFQASAPEEFQQLAATGNAAGAPAALSFAAAGYYRQGRWEEALAAYTELAAKEGAGGLDVAAGLGVASALEAQGEYEAAASALDGWLEKNAGHFLEPLAVVDAARCHREAGNYDRARVICEDYKVAHPDDEVAQARLDEALALIAQAERAASKAAAEPETTTPQAEEPAEKAALEAPAEEATPEAQAE